MATDFAMPMQQPNFNLYNTHSQQVSPTSSTTGTPNNGSPTSPRGSMAHLPGHVRQLRPPKSPLYVPAVLRPTDPPMKRATKASPLTPPQSMSGSFDGSDKRTPLSRRGTGDSGKFGLGHVEEHEWATGSGYGACTASPTRSHWKPDSASSICDDSSCTRTFTYFKRRHHCRRCGNIYCDTHSSYAVPLDQDAAFHPRGGLQRACESCWAEYKSWEFSRTSRSNSETSEDSEGTSTPIIGCKGRVINLSGKREGGMAESLGASVPRDWTWSTF